MQELISEVKSNITDCTLIIPDTEYKTYFLLARWNTILSLWYDDWAFGTYYISSCHVPSRENGSWFSVYADISKPNIDDINNALNSWGNPRATKYKSYTDYLKNNKHISYDIISL